MKNEKIAPVVEQSSLRGRDFGDIIEVVILLVVLVIGFFYTVHGLSDRDSISGSHNRYYEARGGFE